MKRILLAGASCIFFTANAHAAEEMPSQAEMWKMIQMQQQQIETLTKQLKQNETTIAETKVEAEKATQVSQKNSQTIDEGLANISPASGASGWWERTSIGGYGELHANFGSTKDEFDAHRLVTFLAHEFNDSMRFLAEIEVEHADEIFLEQGYLEFDLGEMHQARLGGILVPVGILNEVHEPTTFYGVERNPIETNIIPTTWREGGAMLSGRTESGFSYDLAVHTGLNNNLKSNTYKPRDGRGKLSNQDFEDGAATARVKYTGIAGVELGATVHYQQDIDQGKTADDAEAMLFEAHTDIQRGPWGFRALAALWDIESAAAEALGRDTQYGFYVEPSYKFKLPWQIGDAGIFARYNQYDNAAGMGSDTMVQQVDVGFNYWPDPDIVLKTDVAIVRPGNSLTDVNDEIVNMGVGFVF